MRQLPHMGIVLGMHAHTFPDKIGARDLERAMTFRTWHERSCRLANALMGLGLSKGDRVCVLAYNCVEWLEIYAATALAGLVAVPINFRLVGPEIRYIVENCEAGALIVQDELIDAIEPVRDTLPLSPDKFIIFGTNRRHAGYRAYEDLIAAASDRPPAVTVRPEDPWTLMYTSGTTGKPKGAIRTHRWRRDAVARDRRRAWLQLARLRPAGHADVPRQLAVLLRRLCLLRRGLHGLQPEEL